MWIWLVVAVVAVIGELVTTDLFLAAVAAAALVAAGSALILPGVIQVVVFAVLALVGITVFRPLIKHALGIDATAQIHGPVTHSHLAGRQAVVTQQVDNLGGQIRIGQGEFWSARPFDHDSVIPPGQTVEIMLVDGLTALVEPVPPSHALEAEVDVAQQKGS